MLGPLNSSQRRIYWEKTLLRWENWRYSPIAALNPFAWTVRARLEDLLSVVRREVRPEDRVVDLGCGSGILASRIEPLPFSHFLGVDLSSRAISRAKDRLKGREARYQFEVGDVNDQGLKWNTDLLIAAGVADWITPEELGSLLNRITTRKLILTFTERQAGISIPFYSFYHRLLRTNPGAITARTHTYSEIKSILQSSGFQVEELRLGGRLNPGRVVVAVPG